MEDSEKGREWKHETRHIVAILDLLGATEIICGLKGRQIQCLEQGCIAGEYASLAVQLPICRIQRFYGVCRVNYLSDLYGKLKNRRNGIPILIPALHGIRVLFGPFFGDFFKFLQCCFLGRGLINRF